MCIRARDVPGQPVEARARAGCQCIDRFPFEPCRRLSCTAVTEIPEHLLKRSQAAKAKATGAEAPADAPAAAAPRRAPRRLLYAKAAAPAAPAKRRQLPSVRHHPSPTAPVVAAAKARKKIPFWAMATLSLLPLWVFMYARGLTPKEPVVHGALGEGAEIYTCNCSRATAPGRGWPGLPVPNGEVLKTFPQHRGPTAVRLQRHAEVRAGRHPDLRQPQPRRRPAHRPCPRHHAGRRASRPAAA